MSHTAILIVPVLMLADYALTLAGARVRSRAIAFKLNTQHTALNPLWRRTIAGGFNPAYLVFVVLVTWALVAADARTGEDDTLLAAVTGFLAGLYGAIVGHHLGSLAIFAHLRRHHRHDRASAMSDDTAIWLSMFQLNAALLPVTLVAILQPSPTVIAAGGGVLTLMLIHLAWIARHRRAVEVRV